MGGLSPAPLLVALALAACSGVPSTVRVTVTAPGLTIAALTLEADLGDADAGRRGPLPLGGAGALPGTIVIVVSDGEPLLHVHLDATLADGSHRQADGQVRSIAHREVTLPLVLGDGVAPGDMASVEMASADLGLADMSPMVLAEDSFHRPNQTYWGTASDGQTWSGDANLSTVFSIATNRGAMTNTASSNYRAMLGPKVPDAEVLATGSSSMFANGTVDFGVIVRVVDGNNFYEVLIDGSTFRIHKTAGASKSDLAVTPFTAAAGASYSIRARAVGSAIAAKVWDASQSEPAGWMLQVNDSAFSNGQCGVRALVPLPALVTFSHFVAYRY